MEQATSVDVLSRDFREEGVDGADTTEAARVFDLCPQRFGHVRLLPLKPAASQLIFRRTGVPFDAVALESAGVAVVLEVEMPA
jgi:hypothetical protein